LFVATKSIIVFRSIFLGRCLPGYPFKCPKLQITPEMGLSETDANKLLSLLLDQVRACSFKLTIFSLLIGDVFFV
jgi:hypothetical protein